MVHVALHTIYRVGITVNQVTVVTPLHAKLQAFQTAGLVNIVLSIVSVVMKLRALIAHCNLDLQHLNLVAACLLTRLVNHVPAKHFEMDREMTNTATI